MKKLILPKIKMESQLKNCYDKTFEEVLEITLKMLVYTARKRRKMKEFKFFSTDKEFEKYMLKKRKEGFIEREQTSFEAPNIACIETHKTRSIDVTHVPRQEIGKFTRFLEDVWK